MCSASFFWFLRLAMLFSCSRCAESPSPSATLPSNPIFRLPSHTHTHARTHARTHTHTHAHTHTHDVTLLFSSLTPHGISWRRHVTARSHGSRARHASSHVDTRAVTCRTPLAPRAKRQTRGMGSGRGAETRCAPGSGGGSRRGCAAGEGSGASGAAGCRARC
eukprot:2761712-Rhodomonas_salina.1